MAETPGRGIRFRDSMPRPLLLTFLAFAGLGVVLIVVLFIRPPTPGDLALERRRSPPVGSFTHDVVRAAPVDVPTPIPDFTPPCPAAEGVVVEGGEPAVQRLEIVFRSLCVSGLPPEAERAVRGLSGARIRFALFTRTGDQSTADLSVKRILLSVVLARTNVTPGVIAPLLAHEGWHLAHGAPVTASQEYGARLAELQICRRLFEPSVFTRGCLDAQAIVLLGEERAVELLSRAGFPR